jgi:hypothetical protein
MQTGMSARRRPGLPHQTRSFSFFFIFLFRQRFAVEEKHLREREKEKIFGYTRLMTSNVKSSR